MLVYLTDLVKCSLFSAGVDIRHDSGILAQPFLHFPSLRLFLPLTPFHTALSSQLTERGKEEGGKSVISLSFSRALCFALEVSSCSELPVEQQIWWSHAGAGRDTGTHLPASSPRPQATFRIQSNLSPQHSTAPRSCSLALKPLTGTCTTQNKPFIQCRLQDVSIQCRKGTGR